MPKTFDPAAAASLLAATWRSGEQIAELPAPLRPASLPDAYDVQDGLIAEMGRGVAGWKLGIASRNAMRQARLDRPVAGRILAPGCLRSGDTVVSPNRAPVTIEFEVAFVLGDDVGAGAAPARLGDLVASTHVTFELVQSRFVDFRAAGIPSFAADNAGFLALVVSEAVDPSAVAELVRSVSVTLDGAERARARSGDDLIDGMESFAGLVAHARDRGLTLRAGDIVSTGSVTAPFDVAGPRAEIVARFLGSEELRVTLQAPA